MGAFWPERSEARTRRCLSTTLWRLRSALDPNGIVQGANYITAEGDRIVFNWQSNYWLDVQAFERALTPFLQMPVEQIQPFQCVEQALAPEKLNRRVPWSMVKEVYVESECVDDDALPALPGLAVYGVPRPGRAYMIGADPAEGNLRSDPSAAGGEDAVTWTQVAKFSGRWEVGTFGAHIGALAAFYNEAIVMR